jgi:hypothetical protein
LCTAATCQCPSTCICSLLDDSDTFVLGRHGHELQATLSSALQASLYAVCALCALHAWMRTAHLSTHNQPVSVRRCFLDARGASEGAWCMVVCNVAPHIAACAMVPLYSVCNLPPGSAAASWQVHGRRLAERKLEIGRSAASPASHQGQACCCGGGGSSICHQRRRHGTPLQHQMARRCWCTGSRPQRRCIC